MKDVSAFNRLVKAGLLCLALLLPFAHSAFSAAGWKDRAFYDNTTQKWTVEISSTVTKQMDCTISWEAIQMGLTSEGGGKKRAGNLTVPVPAYKGSGPAVIVRRSIGGVADFKHTTVCND